MGHCIQGIIAKTTAISVAELPDGWPTPVALSQGYSIIPMFDAVLDGIAKEQGDGVFDGFTFLDGNLQERLKLFSKGFSLVYLETDYFGGNGSQGAIACESGQIVFGPESGKIGPINKALSRIGVSRSWTLDEFDALALGKLCGMDDFSDFAKYETD